MQANRCGCVISVASALLCMLAPLPTLADDPPPLELTLQETLDLALQNNRPLLNRRLDREVERFSLEVTEDRWTPQATIRPFARKDRQDHQTGVSSQLSLRVPTGGQFSLSWDERMSGQFGSSRSQALSFNQPLLRGAWIDIETAPVRQARLGEKVSILSFRQALESLIISVIGAYRALIGSGRQVEIAETALLRAREQLQATRALIRAGRVATREAVRAEVTVANRELSLTQAQNRLDATNFRLLDILELDSTVRIQPLEKLRAEPIHPVFEAVFEEALRKRPDYLQAGIAIDAAHINLAVAKNNLLPDLSLGVNLSDSDSGRGDVQVQLNLAVPFNERSRDVNHMRARNNLLKAERNQVELRTAIEVAVRQAVNDVAVGLRLTELARGARELAEQNLTIEREKFNNGLSSSFEVSASEDELVSAEQAEVNSIIAYLDVLIRLDQTAGRTLESWGIAAENLP